jgi:hypothetical protein
MKEIQDQLGSYHDNDVWENWLPKFIDQERARIEEYFGNAGPLKRLLPGLHYLMEDRKRAKAAAYEAFALNWQTLRDERVWDHLRELIHAPLEAVPAEPASPEPEGEAQGDTAPVDVSGAQNEEETVEIELTSLPDTNPEEAPPNP